jgi:hypothetical protein
MFLVYTSSGMFLLESAIKHPQAPQKMIIVAIAEIIIFEERSGGVAAIEQPR